MSGMAYGRAVHCRCRGLPCMVAQHFRRFIRAESGMAGVEFALIAPLFVLILAGTVEIALILHAQFHLNAQVSVAANYSLINGGQIGEGKAEALSLALLQLLEGGVHAIETSVDVNAGGGADAYYCPSNDGGSISWGPARDFLAPCADESSAGQFIAIEASAQPPSLFGGFGLTDGGSVSARAIVRVK